MRGQIDLGEEGKTEVSHDDEADDAEAQFESGGYDMSYSSSTSSSMRGANLPILLKR